VVGGVGCLQRGYFRDGPYPPGHDWVGVRDGGSRPSHSSDPPCTRDPSHAHECRAPRCVRPGGERREGVGNLGQGVHQISVSDGSLTLDHQTVAHQARGAVGEGGGKGSALGVLIET